MGGARCQKSEIKTGINIQIIAWLSKRGNATHLKTKWYMTSSQLSSTRVLKRPIVTRHNYKYKIFITKVPSMQKGTTEVYKPWCCFGS